MQEMVDKMQAVAYITHQQFDEHVVDDNRPDIVDDNNDMLYEMESIVQCYLYNQVYLPLSGIADDYIAIQESDYANRLEVEPCMDWT